MENVFLKLLNMSIAAGWLVLAVTALRFLLKKAPKALRCVLWALVGIRLICPFSFESALSLIPSAETVPEEMFVMEPPENRQSAVIDVEVNPLLPGDYTPELDATVDRLQIGHIFGTLLWLPGVAVMLLYAAVSFLRLRRRVKVSLNVRENLWICDDIKTPFILGILKPRVYLPSHMDARYLAHVVAHENAHIRRRDHWWKPIGFFLLAVYWFNPLIWLAYILLCRDIELACDERVVKEMGSIERKAYSEALLSFSVPQRMVTACPLAFGEVGVKERIRNVLSYKKPAFWIIVAAAAACVVLAVCFLTNPKEGQDLSFLNYENLVTLAAQADTLPVHVSIQSDAVDDTVDSNNLAAFLDNASWTPQRGILRSVQRETDKNSTASIQIQFNENVWMTIFDTDTAYVYSNGQGRYYRMQDGDYKKALVLVSSSDSSGIVADSSVLTLNDVIVLSQKGDGLSWVDFDSYSYIETGSGLYIRVYEINSLFSLWIGGGLTSEKPMYIYLKADTGTDDYIDIRTEDVTAFISAHKDALLDVAVSAAILEHNSGKYSDSDFACESHVTLATLPGERWDEDSNSMIKTVEIYLMALYQEYQYSGSSFSNTGGSHIPCVLTFDDTKAGYVLTDYWEPRDGSYYKPDIEKRFRGLDAATISAALDTQKYISEQQKECDEKAEQYLAGLTSDGAAGGLDVEPIRVYVFEESEDVVKPSVALYENGEFSFTFSALSSYLGHGTYKISDNCMILKTDDGSYQYVFDMVDDALVFDADSSSSQTWFSGIYDGAVFE